MQSNLVLNFALKHLLVNQEMGDIGFDVDLVKQIKTAGLGGQEGSDVEEKMKYFYIYNCC